MQKESLRVAFDDQIFISQKYGGISRYFSNLVREISLIDGIEPKIISPLYSNIYASSLSKQSVFGRSFSSVPKSGRVVTAITPVLSKFAISLFSPHITHETYYAPRPRLNDKKVRVLTVFDMIHELFPDQFSEADPTSRYKRLAVNRADHIFCISNQTRSDLIRLFNVEPAKITVTYLGLDRLDANQTSRKANNSRPYVLYVGNRGGYKNFKTLIEAFALLPSIRENFRIVCFGGGAFTQLEYQHMKALGLSLDLIEQRGGTDAQLAIAYQGASILVYPSLYEGFGISPLEAMSLGCPVVASNTSSIPEVVGDAAELFDPYHAESVANAIENVVSSKSRSEALINLGYKRCARFSWRACASRTVDVYRAIAG